MADPHDFREGDVDSATIAHHLADAAAIASQLYLKNLIEHPNADLSELEMLEMRALSLTQEATRRVFHQDPDAVSALQRLDAEIRAARSGLSELHSVEHWRERLASLVHVIEAVERYSAPS